MRVTTCVEEESRYPTFVLILGYPYDDIVGDDGRNEPNTLPIVEEIRANPPIDLTIYDVSY